MEEKEIVKQIAGQERFKNDVIDKWIGGESLERLTENIKSFSKKKASSTIKVKRFNNGSTNTL